MLHIDAFRIVVLVQPRANLRALFFIAGARQGFSFKAKDAKTRRVASEHCQVSIQMRMKTHTKPGEVKVGGQS